jgi:GLPGLI family protein
MKQRFIFFLAFCMPLCVHSQTNIQTHSQENADTLDVSEEIEKQSLDAATVRVYYHFTQKEKAGEETVFRNDTMTLDIGAQMSYYYDETKAKKDSLPMTNFCNMLTFSLKRWRFMIVET